MSKPAIGQLGQGRQISKRDVRTQVCSRARVMHGAEHTQSRGLGISTEQLSEFRASNARALCGGFDSAQPVKRSEPGW
ncbi:uncharacterized protein GLRG_08835 [Colletotrichum graminicola M1.001]|uniref:Uncharacterized protein n=1 Tax=Colletotrichum graminicola (strain M1.001 / M2 / FGSC 10212) TaxID=645133 RepID=E3QRR8_COLGM|nr:uncharacterized protein GLRG_08835 [Colletotrichum graminicola M1.001]EFQ33556.1 hypothetical protein GLRG_08835 [Colletotrichum graminicola M1.001]